MKITLSPTVTEMSPGEQRTIRRALNLLAKQLREPGVAFTSTSVTRDWLRLHLTGLEREIFVVLWLDNQNRLLAQETLFTGTINSTTVHPRELVKSTMRRVPYWRTIIRPSWPSPVRLIDKSPTG
jgi:DNA repair protein RadC